MHKAMKLRNKMTLWYTGLTVVSIGTFACVLYFLTNYVMQEMLEREARLSLQQLSAQVELDGGMLTFENEVPISSGSMYYIMEDNGSELASYGKDITFFEDVPIDPGQFRTVKSGSDEWLLLDSELLSIEPGIPNRGKGDADELPSPESYTVQREHYTVRVRVAVSCALKQRVLSMLLMVLGVGIPLITLFALIGGFMIAKRALRPIRQIIHSADIISDGELSERIPDAPAHDELGELTDTLNRMLSSVETSIMREKRFASDASHELRTPVTVMRACTEIMLSDKSVTDNQKSSLQAMLIECEHMQKIIKQLLTITRGQEGHYPIFMESVNLKVICDTVAETFSDMLFEKAMSLRIEIADAVGLKADQSLLTELILNLVENAIKYGKSHGQICVTASTLGGWVEIRISDDGIGMAKEVLPFIFDRFYRVDTARDRTGTGLGLSIVKWIVQVHHGSIRAESELGKGTTFVIVLPTVQSDAQ